jgi:glycosyltransferase involved in cell wall biosynthesis
LKVSIITVVFNGAQTLSSCIDSVLSQNYPSIEYIVVDGNSSDGTQMIVQDYGKRISHFISEPDHGIYDAMNKGIALASGEIIGILNADDFYADSVVISNVVERLKTENAAACYGDLDYVDGKNTGLVIRKWKAGEYSEGSFVNGWMPPHPSFFLSRKAYSDWGCFRLDMGSAADYELMLRMIHKHGIKPLYLPKVLVKMRVGGVSNNTIKNRWRANRNDKKAWKINGMKPRFYTFILKPMRKISQFFA